MLDRIRVLSLSPGRLRFKIQEHKKAEEMISDLCERVSELPGIIKIEIKQTTGSVVVLYDKQLFASNQSVENLRKALAKQLTSEELDRLRTLLQSEQSVANIRKSLSELLSSPEVDRLHAMLQSLVT